MRLDLVRLLDELVAHDHDEVEGDAEVAGL